jgi:predicted O-methyltransferase YrrM
VISIIIPTCQSRNFFPCIDSVLKYTDSKNVEIIPVFNGFDVIQPGAQLWFDEKIGYPAAINAGIKASHGEFIVLLNDDTQLLPQEKNQWINILSAPFADPKMAITGPWKMVNTEIERDFICFFCCMIRKSVLDEIGLLDETFGAGYGEDVDLSCKAVNAGYKIAQVPIQRDIPYDGRMGHGDFPIYHAGNETFRNWPGGEDLLRKNHAILRDRYDGVLISNAQKFGEWVSDDELRWLARRARNAKCVIELGSWFGKTATAIADNLPKDGVLYCVDTWAGSKAEQNSQGVEAAKMDGDYVYDQFCRNLSRHIVTGKVRTIRMHGNHAAKRLTEMGIKADMVFIDAGHTYEEVKEDILTYAPLVKEGGILCGHDFGQSFWPGVAQAVDEIFGVGKCFNPGTTIWSTTELPRPNIYECMMFNNEFDMLEKQLSTMWDVVDRFVICEAPITHSAKPKPLYFKENMARFEKYLSKISHVLVDDSPPFDGSEQSAWNIEAHQRDSMMRALGNCKPNDIIVVVDCDEIPVPETVKNFKGQEPTALLMDLYLFDYKVKGKDKWRHGKITPYWQLQRFSPTGVRYLVDCPDVAPGGVHLSYFGGTEQIRHKIMSNAHLNVAKPEFTDEKWIQHCIENGLDLFKRDIQYEVVA